MMHRFADELVYQYTGEQGIARSWIAFVSEVESGKELFIMDYDGYHPRRLTYDASLNLAPAWSPISGAWLLFRTETAMIRRSRS